MMNKNILKRKYPFPENNHWLRDSVMDGVIVFLILYFLQPFGFSMYTGNKLMASLIFGLLTLVCTAVYLLTTRPLRQHVQPWRVWHQALHIIGLVLFIGICNWLVFSFIFHYQLTIELFLYFLYWTFIIGVIITVVSVGIGYNSYLRGRMETLLENSIEEQQDVVVTIHDSSVRGNDLTLPINNLLYVEAQKNNVMVYANDAEGRTTSTELHATLSSVLADLHDYANIFQCHRSFVVNLNNITSAKGNSNGYQLTLGKCPAVVPVSRTYVPKLKSFIA
ncbi:MAG: LytTR family transcriptional regulator DNA-binding domain-containing protein [Prevotella sp.]|nr:LytTR family transcriptional regulator DNA-binding domain-containing protein [Prevotella sp.]